MTDTSPVLLNGVSEVVPRARAIILVAIVTFPALY